MPAKPTPCARFNFAAEDKAARDRATFRALAVLPLETMTRPPQRGGELRPEDRWYYAADFVIGIIVNIDADELKAFMREAYPGVDFLSDCPLVFAAAKQRYMLFLGSLNSTHGFWTPLYSDHEDSQNRSEAIHWKSKKVSMINPRQIWLLPTRVMQAAGRVYDTQTSPLKRNRANDLELDRLLNRLRMSTAKERCTFAQNHHLFPASLSTAIPTQPTEARRLQAAIAGDNTVHTEGPCAELLLAVQEAPASEPPVATAAMSNPTCTPSTPDAAAFAALAAALTKTGRGKLKKALSAAPGDPEATPWWKSCNAIEDAVFLANEGVAPEGRPPVPPELLAAVSAILKSHHHTGNG